MEKIRIGVIGTGHLGRLHTKMFSQNDKCVLTGVFDEDIEKAKKVAVEFNTHQFESINNLLSNVDAVSIAVTTSAHYNVAKAAFSAGKSVFIEKPVTALINEAEELVKTASELGLVFQVGHIERFNPALLAVEKYNLSPLFIQSDRLAQFNPRGTDVAVVLDLMIHDIDIILSLIKSEVASVSANGVGVVSKHIDIANCRIEFENGAVAVVTASRISQKKMRKMRIFQSDSYIALDFNSGIAEVFRLAPVLGEIPAGTISFGEIGVGDLAKRVVYEQPEVFEINALEHELKLFVEAVENKSKPVVSGEDGLRALRVANMIIEKIEESARRFS